MTATEEPFIIKRRIPDDIEEKFMKRKIPADFEETFTKRKIPAQNLPIRLRDRELGLYSKPNVCELINKRKFYLSVVPNSTISNVEKPPCFLRKFSPDGRFLIAFSVSTVILCF